MGDIYQDRLKLGKPAPAGRAYICDTLPFEGDGPVSRVCVETEGGKREWLDVGELDRRFVRR